MSMPVGTYPPRRTRSRALAAIATTGLVLGLAACTSTAANNSTSTTASNAAIERAVAAARAVVTADSRPQTNWTGPSSSPAPAKGKTVVVIPCAAAAVGCLRNVQGFEAAAKVLGWKTIMIDPAGDINKTHAAISSAIALHANGIWMSAVEPLGSASQIKQAEKAGIVVMDSASGSQLVDDEVNIGAEAQGQMIGAFIAASTNGRGHVLILQDPSFTTTRDRLAGTMASLKKYCLACTITNAQFSITEIGTTLGAKVKSILEANPDINMVWLPYDAASPAVVPAIQQMGLGSKVSVVGFDADPQTVGYIQTGQVETASVGTPPEWLGWAGAYEMNRVFNHEKPLPADNIPGRLITRANAAQVGGQYLGDINFSAIYTKLWQAGPRG